MHGMVRSGSGKHGGARRVRAGIARVSRIHKVLPPPLRCHHHTAAHWSLNAHCWRACVFGRAAQNCGHRCTCDTGTANLRAQIAFCTRSNCVWGLCRYTRRCKHVVATLAVLVVRRGRFAARCGHIASGRAQVALAVMIALDPEKLRTPELERTPPRTIKDFPFPNKKGPF